MGGTVSAGTNNDELIDNLVEADFIKTPHIQHIFRAVDRGNYYADGHKENPYRDMAWRSGNLHLSAPCVYSEVMEALKLRSGMSFLNLGSGSGYLSTMAGLTLGPYGINHGIELYSDVVDFAYKKLEHFMKNSTAVDEFEFCEPVFIVGNCLMIDSNCQQYDRVYCGAACPEEHENYIKNLVKVGGILIMPLNDKLLKITRTSESTWQSVKVLSVSFAPLISPQLSKGPVCHVKLTDFCPPTLQELCRSKVRTVLRSVIDFEHPHLRFKAESMMEKRQCMQVRRIVIPIFDESDSNSDSDGPDLGSESDHSVNYTLRSRSDLSSPLFVLENVLRRHAEIKELAGLGSRSRGSDTLPCSRDIATPTTSQHINESRDDAVGSLRRDGPNCVSVIKSVKGGTNDNDEARGSHTDTDRSDSISPRTDDNDKPGCSTSNEAGSDGISEKIDDIKSKSEEIRSKIRDLKTRCDAFKQKMINKIKNLTDDKEEPRSSTRTTATNVSSDEMETELSSSDELMCSASFITLSNKKHNCSVPKPTTSRVVHRPSCIRKRKHPDSEPSTSTDRLSRSRVKLKRRAATVVWKRLVPKESSSDRDENDKTKYRQKVSPNSIKEDNYTDFMVLKISSLPLPLVIKKFINYRRNNM